MPSDDYYTNLEQRLRALEPDVEALAPGRLESFREYLEHGEYGLAVETVATQLPADDPSDRVRSLADGLLDAARTMGLGGSAVEHLDRVTSLP